MKTTIFTNGISKESDKAILVKCLVSYNANANKEREIWMPKSVTANVTSNTIDVEDWFLNKLSSANAFHGYRMTFERGIIC